MPCYISNPKGARERVYFPNDDAVYMSNTNTDKTQDKKSKIAKADLVAPNTATEEATLDPLTIIKRQIRPTYLFT